MALFFIAYDLDKPGQNYKGIHAYLKKLGGERVLESTWVVRSDSSTTKILKAMTEEEGLFDANDRIVVIKEADWSSANTMIAIKDF